MAVTHVMLPLAVETFPPTIVNLITKVAQDSKWRIFTRSTHTLQACADFRMVDQSEPTCPCSDSDRMTLSDSVPERREQTMQIRCPHCHNPIEVASDVDFESLCCPSCDSEFSLVAPTTDHRGKQQRIAHFELKERLGIGAFGTVWKAYDENRPKCARFHRRYQSADWVPYPGDHDEFSLNEGAEYYSNKISGCDIVRQHAG